MVFSQPQPEKTRAALVLGAGRIKNSPGTSRELPKSQSKTEELSNTPPLEDADQGFKTWIGGAWTPPGTSVDTVVPNFPQETFKRQDLKLPSRSARGTGDENDNALNYDGVQSGDPKLMDLANLSTKDFCEAIRTQLRSNPNFCKLSDTGVQTDLLAAPQTLQRDGFRWGVRNGLNAEHISFIHGYAGSLYDNVNKELRNGKNKSYDTKAIRSVMVAGMGRLPPFVLADKVDRYVYLTDSEMRRYVSGKNVVEPSFLSTTCDPDYKFSGAQREGSTLVKFNIYLKGDKTGCRDIGPLTKSSTEKEILFPPNTKFKVEKIEKPSGGDLETVVILREI